MTIRPRRRSTTTPQIPCLPSRAPRSCRGKTSLSAPVPGDRAAVQARSDVLVFESEPIPAPLEITGFVHADLWIEADPAGADVVVALSEARADGSRPHVTDGILRLQPTQSPIGPQVVCVELGAASIVLSGGSRLVIEVAGSCFPRFDVHPRQRSRLRLFHDAARPSRIVLPTVQQSF